ncbi:hypothetical protein BSLG_005948 [Batrachochytrium salamandrivorans]|nr:hypothetical protein BSLG_005948 [Batrachochytrium salamandrivorans]
MLCVFYSRPVLLDNARKQLVTIRDTDLEDIGYVDSVSGPVVVDEHMDGCAMFGLDPVLKTGKPLSVELVQVFAIVSLMAFKDLSRTFKSFQSIYIPRGINTPALDKTIAWDFEPINFKVGDHVTGGDIYAIVYENTLISYNIMVPPKGAGTITFIAPKGQYTLQDTVLVEFSGAKTSYTMLQMWPVRTPRPVTDKLAAADFLCSPVNVFWTLFSLVYKAVLLPFLVPLVVEKLLFLNLSKYSNSNVIIYVGCGERGNEMAEVLMDFPELSIEIEGGKDVAMMADSTSRWAEALREISGRLAEMPVDSGYPAYLGARLASFYERAGKVVCLETPLAKAVVSIVGAVSPPGGDFSDPVTSCHSRHLTHTTKALNPTSLPCVTKPRNLVNEEDLSEIVQLVGKSALAESDKITLEIAKILKDDYLQQNGYSNYDRFCPFYKTVGMLRNMMFFMIRSIHVVEASAGAVTWAKIRDSLVICSSLASMKFEDPADV